jgi:hypothetical protein
MGILPSTKAPAATPASIKRRSGQLDFASLGPLKTSGTVGFSAFREHHDEAPNRKKKSRSKSNGSAMMDEDSEDDDDDDEILGKMEDVDNEKEDKDRLGPEDAKFSGELADGVKRIKVGFVHVMPRYVLSVPELT